MAKPSVDLKLLSKLVTELELALNSANTFKKVEVADGNIEYIVEMSKCAGLAAGVMAEAALLVGDIQATIGSVQSLAVKGNDPLLKLLSGIKDPGTPDKN